MSAKTREISVLVHKDTPECCRASLLKFAAGDRYQGGGEPGDRIRCGCGNWLVFGAERVLGWRVAALPGTAGSERRNDERS